MLKRFLVFHVLCSCLFSCSNNYKERVTEVPVKIKSDTLVTHHQDSIIQSVDSSETVETLIIHDTLNKVPTHQQKHPITVKRKDSSQVIISETTEPEITVPPISTNNLRLPKKLTHLDIPAHGNLNTRQWVTLFYNTFKEGDYITGNEMAAYYETTTHLHHMGKSSIISFFQNHIERITRKNNQLVFTTLTEEGVKNAVHIPLLVDISYEIKDGASIAFYDTFTSNKGEFKGWPMLPIDISGVMVIQKKDTVPNKGYINNNAYFIDYPNSMLNYKIHR